MDRRGFLGSLVALVVAPFAPAVTAAPEVYRVTPIYGLQALIDSGPGPMMIHHTTFKFWRNGQLAATDTAQAMRDIYDGCYSTWTREAGSE